jgi:hypothetical protein
MKHLSSACKRLSLFVVIALASISATAGTYYWVGGSGNWSDFSNHWATTSGGSAFQSSVPSQFDDVVFDANSFTAPGQTVTQDVEAFCRNMTWTGVSNNPAFSSSKPLHIYASVKMSSAMTLNFTNTIFFDASTTGNNIDMAGKSVSSINFTGQGSNTGGWVLQSKLTTTGYLYFTRGSLSSNGHRIDAHSFYANDNNPMTINFTGTDTIFVKYEWRINPSTSISLTMGGAAIKFQNPEYIYFAGGNKTYSDLVVEYTTTAGYHAQFDHSNTYRDVKIKAPGNQSFYFYSNSTYRDLLIDYTSALNSSTTVYFNGSNTINKLDVNSTGTVPNLYLYGSNTISTLSVDPGANISLAGSQTQTVSTLIANGTCAKPIDIFSTYPGVSATISKSSGVINIDYVTLQDITAQGGAVFNATNSKNFGNNTGWNITPVAAATTTFYWVGGTGNWSDPTHWSLTSGGVGGGCGMIPTRIDDVVFDANSFTTTSQVVYIDIEAETKNMTWTGVTNNPTFNMSGRSLSVYASLTLSPNMTVQSAGQINLESKVAGNTISTFNQPLGNIYFRGQNSTTVTWTLQSRLRSLGLINIERGGFISNAQQVDCNTFYSWTGNVTNINFTGTDTVFAKQEWTIINGSQVTLNMGTAVIKQTPGNQSGVFRGGNKTYNDIVVNYVTAGGYSYSVEHNNVIRDLKMDLAGPVYLYFHHSNTFRHVNINYSAASSQTPSITFGQTNNFQNVSVTATGLITPNLYLNSSNTFNSLTIGEGVNVLLGANQTQTTGDLTAVGTCARKISIVSQTPGFAGRISKSSGTVNADWLKLQDVAAIGGATFNAVNTLDFGNVTGWNITGIAPKNFYWVGGTGNWNDPNHWSTSSGGAPTGCAIPTRADNVIFDVNSFSAAGQTVTLNANGECRSFSWNNVSHTPLFNGATGFSLSVYGSFKLDNKMNFYPPALIFESKTAGNTINTSGKALSSMNFNGQGTTTGEWTLAGPLQSTNFLYFQGGTLRTAGHRMNLYGFNANYNKAMTLDFTGTDTVLIGYEWRVNTSPAVNLLVGGMTILYNTQNHYYFYGGNKTYNDVVVNYTTTVGYQTVFQDNNVIRDVKISANGNQSIYFYHNSKYNDVGITFNNSTGSNPNIYIHGLNTFNDVNVTSQGNSGPYCYIYNANTFNNLSFAGLGTRIYLGSGVTQSVKNFVALGSGGFPVFLQSTNINSQATISQTSGNVCLDFVWMRDIKATGGATFNAGASSTNIANNTGWSFTSCSGYYWVGGSGNWSDLNHWATSSGGSTKQVALPTQFSNVYFDANSFQSANRIVNIDIADPRCLNMSWSSSLFNPTLAGTSSDLNIYGSLVMIAGMNQNFNGNFNFKATGPGFTINTASKALHNANFDGPGGGWTLANSFKANNEVNLISGTLLTNSKDIEAKYFNVLTANSKALTLGGSQVKLINGGWNAADISGLVFQPQISKIIITGTGGNSDFTGAGLYYNNVTFTTPTTLSSTITGANDFENLRFEKGTTVAIEPVMQRINNLQVDGTCNRMVTVKSTAPGSQVTFRVMGSLDVKFVNLSDNYALGAAVFNANLSNDLGNVTGWNFTSTSTLTLNITKVDASCPGRNNGTASVSVTGGSEPYTYLWSTSETGNSISGLIPGTYSVSVVDANGCTASASVTITQPPFVTATAGNNGPVCPGGTLSLTSTGGSTYSWTGPNGFTSTEQNPEIQNITSAGSGTYTVTASNADGCSATASTIVNATDNVAPIAKAKPVTIYLDANGSATLAASDVNNGSTDNCSVASLSINKTSFTCADAGGLSTATSSITYVGSATQNTHSHGGGYNPKTNEFLYPQWAGNTIYKYNSNHTLVSSFTSPQQQIMQLWMDKSSTDYYTANWGYNTVLRISGNSIVWTYNVGTTSACVTTSANHVYSLAWGGNKIVVLNKATGAFVRNINLPGSMYSYGGLVYANGKLYIAGNAYGFSPFAYADNAIHVFDEATGAYQNSVSTITSPYNMAFDGETMWISPNSSQIFGYKIASGNAYDGSGVPVTLTVTDASGNSSNATAVVTVLDNIAPVISSCPGNITVNTGATATACSATATWTPPAVTENCSYTTTVTSSPTAGLTTPGSAFPVGTTTVTYTFEDQSGNKATCAFDVVVNDNTPPAITCPADVLVPNDAGKCGAVVNYAMPGGLYTSGSFDNQLRKLDPVTFGTVSSKTITLANGYVYQTTGMAIDPTTGFVYAILNSNQNTSGRSLAKIDTATGAATIIGATGDLIAGIAFSTNGTLYGINGIADNPAFALVSINKTTGASTFLKTLTNSSGHTIAYNTDDQMIYHFTGNVMEKVDPVTLTVTNVPTSGAAGGPSMSATYAGGGKFYYTDRYSQMFSVTSTGVRTFITYPGHYAKGMFMLKGGFGGTSSDNCSVKEIVQTAGLPSGSLFPLGTTINTFHAVDAAGNISESCSFTVTVEDKEGPVVSCKNITVELDANGVATITAADINNGSADLCNDIASTSISKSSFNCNDLSAGVADLTYIGSVLQETHGHGGGYDPHTNQFLYPEWAGSTIYRYSSTHTQLGSFNSGQDQMMQVWMDKQSNDYYTANWGYYTVTRRNGSSVVWSYNLGYYASSVTTDDNYVYAMTYGASTVTVLSKSTGAFVKQINLGISLVSWGALAYANGKFYIGGHAQGGTQLDYYDNAIHVFNAVTGAYEKSYSTVVNPYNMAFDGETMWISDNSNTIYGYRLPVSGVPVTLQVTDTKGNSRTCTAYVKVVDNSAPIISNCPSDISVTTDQTSTSCEQVVTWTPPTVTDNCGVITEVSSAPTAGLTTPGATFPVGTTTITYTFKDASNNVSSCSFDVVVGDKTAPSITCAPDVTVTNDEGSCTGSVTLTAPQASDNCGVQSVTNDHPSTTYPVGTTVVTWTVTDVHGNTSTCEQTVTVEDKQAPSVTCAPNIVVNNDQGSCTGTVTLTAPTTGDNCGVQTVINDHPSTSYPVGATIVTWTVTDIHGNTSTCEQTVTVEDKQAPSITCAPNVTVTSDEGFCTGTVTLIAPTTGDNCGVQSVTNDHPSTTYPVGTTLVTWTVTDIHGNTNTDQQTVTVNDTQAPSISCAPNVTVTTADGLCAASVTLTAPSASDNCGVQSIVNDHPSTVFMIGTTKVTWTVTDIHNNITTCEQLVTVLDTEKPTVTCKNVSVSLVNGVASITPADVHTNASDNCGIKSIEISKSAFNCSNIGANNVVVTVTDNADNVTTCNSTVTVVGQTSTCSISSVPTSAIYTGGVSTNLYLGYGAQSTKLQVNALNGAPFTYAWTGSNLCSYTSAAPVFTPTQAGSYTFTVTVTNGSGCISTCSITICVMDIRVPGSNGKVYLCHSPSGNSSNGQTLAVAVNSVAAHLQDHAGDRLGQCDQMPCTMITGQEMTSGGDDHPAGEKVPVTTEEFSVKVYDNPALTQFTLKVTSSSDEFVNLRVVDVTGRVVTALSNLSKHQLITFGQDFLGGSYFAEVTQGKNRKTVKLIKLN